MNLIDYDNRFLAKLEEALSRGATLAIAARYAGVSPSRLAGWCKQDLEGNPRFRGLNALIDRARADAAIALLACIDASAQDGDWRAAAWKLERLYPEDYGRKITTTHHGNVQISHTIDYSRMTDEELDLLLAQKHAEEQEEDSIPDDGGYLMLPSPEP